MSTRIPEQYRLRVPGRALKVQNHPQARRTRSQHRRIRLVIFRSGTGGRRFKFPLSDQLPLANSLHRICNCKVPPYSGVHSPRPGAYLCRVLGGRSRECASGVAAIPRGAVAIAFSPIGKSSAALLSIFVYPCRGGLCFTKVRIYPMRRRSMKGNMPHVSMGHNEISYHCSSRSIASWWRC